MSQRATDRFQCPGSGLVRGSFRCEGGHAVRSRNVVCWRAERC